MWRRDHACVCPHWPCQIDQLAAGESWDGLLEGYPELTRADIQASLRPLLGTSLTGPDLAGRWSKLDRLPPDEAKAFADDLESARHHLPPLKSGWD